VDTSGDAPRDNAGLAGTLSAYLSGPAFQRLPESQRVATAAAALRVAIRQIVAVYAVEAVALGGGVCDACPALTDETEALVRAQQWLNGPPPRVIRAPLSSDQAGVIGAAMIASD
ncbi:MAG: ROK family protein, partial [Planctomycetota bacterium]